MVSTIAAVLGYYNVDVFLPHALPIVRHRPPPSATSIIFASIFSSNFTMVLARRAVLAAISALLFTPVVQAADLKSVLAGQANLTNFRNLLDVSEQSPPLPNRPFAVNGD